jgi:hypothetical protein
MARLVPGRPARGRLECLRPPRLLRQSRLLQKKSLPRLPRMQFCACMSHTQLLWLQTRPLMLVRLRMYRCLTTNSLLRGTRNSYSGFSAC